MPWTPPGKRYLDAALVGSGSEAETGTGDKSRSVLLQKSCAVVREWQAKGANGILCRDSACEHVCIGSISRAELWSDGM